jgi:hypothetical protein
MIPLFSNIGYSEINSSGNLSDAMGANKSKLPIQYFKLTGDVTGNLTMPNNAAHRKIYLDTNGHSIINPTGSPITNNSSTAITLKGSGDVKSTLTSTSIVNSTTTFQGTNNIAELDGSPLVVSSGFAEISQYMDYQPSSGTGAPNGNSEFRIADGQTGGPNGFGSAWRVRVPSGVSWKVNGTVLTSGTVLNASQMNAAMGASNNFNKVVSFQAIVNDNPNQFDNVWSFPPSGWTANYDSYYSGSGIYKIKHANVAGYKNVLVYNSSAGRFEGRTEYSVYQTTVLGYQSNSRRGNTSPPHTMTINVLVGGQGRDFSFTNNLTIPIVLSGNDPYNDVSVNAGDTATFTRSSTDGSHDITGTITGSSGSNPYALAYVNDGTGTLDVTGYTGINSVSAF